MVMVMTQDIHLQITIMITIIILLTQALCFTAAAGALAMAAITMVVDTAGAAVDLVVDTAAAVDMAAAVTAKIKSGHSVPTFFYGLISDAPLFVNTWQTVLYSSVFQTSLKNLPLWGRCPMALILSAAEYPFLRTEGDCSGMESPNVRYEYR